MPGFSCRQRRMRSCQRRSAETRIRGSRPLSAATSRSRGRRAPLRAARRPRRARPRAPAATTSCAIRMPGSTTNASRAVGVQQHDPQLAAVAGVDEARRVDDRDAVLRREPRTRLDEPRVAVGDRDREPGADERTLAGRELDALAGREVEARIARVRARRHAPRPRRSRRTGSSITPTPGLRRRRASATRNRANRAQLAPRQPRDHEHAVGACPRAPRSARRARRAPRAPRPSAYGTSSRTTSQRLANCSASRAFSSSSPSPGRAPRPAARPGKRFASRRRPTSSTRSILFSTSCDRQLVGADLAAARPRPLATISSSCSSSAEASATCSTRSATSVSSSVAANPSTS